jgi:hypothetical protein
LARKAKNHGKTPQKGENMAKNQSIRIRPGVLQADMDAVTALQSMGDYNPSNPAYAKTAVSAKLNAMKAAQDAETQAQNALSAARDAATAAEWDFHNALLGVKNQIIAQYGDNSDQLQSLGLKNKSERQAPVRKKKATT